MVKRLFATVLVGLAAAVMLGGCSAPWDAPSGSCTVQMGGHDATITFTGNDALSGCQSVLQKANPGWGFEYGSVATGSTQLCSTTLSGIDGTVTISVTDTGGHVYGNQLCQDMAQWQQDAQSS